MNLHRAFRNMFLTDLFFFFFACQPTPKEIKCFHPSLGLYGPPFAAMISHFFFREKSLVSFLSIKQITRAIRSILATSPFSLCFDAFFLRGSIMRPPVFLIAILVCLTGAQRSDIGDNSLALGDGSSAAFSPVLVANGGDDVGSTIWNDLIELDRAFFQDSHSNGNTEPQNPSSTQPDSDPKPEVEPEPVPKPDCTPMEGIPVVDTAVCCIDPPTPLGGLPGIPTTLWSLTLCSDCKSHLFFSFPIWWKIS